MVKRLPTTVIIAVNPRTPNAPWDTGSRPFAWQIALCLLNSVTLNVPLGGPGAGSGVLCVDDRWAADCHYKGHQFLRVRLISLGPRIPRRGPSLFPGPRDEP